MIGKASDPIGSLDSSEIQKKLLNRRPGAVDDPYPPGFLQGAARPASVLMPLLRNKAEWELLFIRRTNIDGDIHSGQVAFPGGGAEPGDRDPIETALREAQEEIGLHPGDVQILGSLGSFRTISNYLVTPIVGIMPFPYPLQAMPAEVSRIFSIPLSWLIDPDNRYVEQRVLPAPHLPVKVIYFKPYLGEVLWGASALFTCEFLSLVSKKIQDCGS